MSVFESPRIRDLSRSWLYFISEELLAGDIVVLHQAGAPRNESNQLVTSGLPSTGYVLAGPAQEWRVSPTVPDTVEASFRLSVITSKPVSGILSAYERNLAIQLIIHNLLFSESRRISGYSTGNSQVYAIPLLEFDPEGEPQGILNSAGLQYNVMTHWVNRSSDGSNSCVWTLDLSISLTS